MVKWKKDQFRQIKESEQSQRLNELSNVWLSTFFGNIVSDNDYYELQNHMSPEKFPIGAGCGDGSGSRGRRCWGRRSGSSTGSREFPEALQGEGRGFDVVIGNPPWVDIQELYGLTEEEIGIVEGSK